jgi:hypothetical protein
MLLKTFNFAVTDLPFSACPNYSSDVFCAGQTAPLPLLFRLTYKKSVWYKRSATKSGPLLGDSLGYVPTWPLLFFSGGKDGARVNHVGKALA